MAIPVRVGPVEADIHNIAYIAQEEQLPEAQLAQELPPPIEEGIPDSSVDIQQAKTDSTRSASLWHSGHVAFSSDWLTGRNFSNFVSQS